MVTSASGVYPAINTQQITLTPASSTGSTDSFAQQLATTLEGYFDKSGSGSKIDVTISKVQGQNSGGSQFLVTIKEESSGPTTATGTVGSTSTSSSAAGAGSSSSSTLTPVTSSSGASPVQHVVGDGQITEIDAYWAQQPAAVQALRDMPDGADKGALALKLSQQGYAIDTQIMVWGWDPQMTMTVRQNEGYTWVPSFGNANIPVGPGISFPGLPSYDANNAPAGSVRVSTDFAKGTIQNWLVQQAVTT